MSKLSTELRSTVCAFLCNEGSISGIIVSEVESKISDDSLGYYFTISEKYGKTVSLLVQFYDLLDLSASDLLSLDYSVDFDEVLELLDMVTSEQESVKMRHLIQDLSDEIDGLNECFSDAGKSSQFNDIFSCACETSYRSSIDQITSKIQESKGEFIKILDAWLYNSHFNDVIMPVIMLSIN